MGVFAGGRVREFMQIKPKSDKFPNLIRLGQRRRADKQVLILFSILIKFHFLLLTEIHDKQRISNVYYPIIAQSISRCDG